MKRQKKGLHALYAADPIGADERVFGRRSHPLTRRGFLSGLGTMSAALGADVVFHATMPAGLIPAALADSSAPFTLTGKDPRLTLLNDRPINAETPAHLLDENVTSAARMFVRNNGIPPAAATAAGAATPAPRAGRPRRGAA